MRSQIFTTTGKVLQKNRWQGILQWQQQRYRHSHSPSSSSSSSSSSSPSSSHSQGYSHNPDHIHDIPAHPSIVEKINAVQIGTIHTPDWRMYFQTKVPLAGKEDNRISPWHDIPVGFETTDSGILFNYVHEIPRGERAKMECTPKEAWNPLKQDVKKGNLRFFKYGDLPFNYGFMPQTWEDPTESSRYADVSDLKGDDDPVDIVEISGRATPRGQIIPVKVLSVLGLIDEGEADWKIIALRADHPQASRISTIEDAERILEVNIKDTVVDWFQKYKVPDGKPENRFTHNAKFHGPEMAMEIVEETHRQWYNLIAGAVKSENSLQSLMRNHLIAHGLTSTKRVQKPFATYLKYENWNQALNVDNTKVYMMEEEGPDRRTRK